jgi:hypothetical protein
MRTDSFDSRVFFIISRVASTDLADLVSGKATVLQTFLIMLSLVILIYVRAFVPNNERGVH